MSLLDWFVLPTIVFAQFAGTSLWFVPNAVVSQVEGFGESQVAALVPCVQAGFIFGTMTLTYFAATDRASPPFLFTVMCLAGAALNAVCITTATFAAWAALRVMVGFCLAGVYPVGLKIAASEYPTGLGARLGVLLGALTLGTAFPWLIRGLGDERGIHFSGTLACVSLLAMSGATLMAVVMIPRQGGPGAAVLRRIGTPRCLWNKKRNATSTELNEQPKSELTDGGKDIFSDKRFQSQEEHDACQIESNVKQNPGETFDLDLAATSTRSKNTPKNLIGLKAVRAILSDSRFRAAAMGYFGHIWELYSFWAFVPQLIEDHATGHDGVILGNVALTSFATIGVGSLSCTLAGIWSLSAGRSIHPGGAIVAMAALMTSLLCCLIAPAYMCMSQGTFLFYLLVWGSAVIADSAQFSGLCADYACDGLVGTALTMTTCIGYSISVISLQVIGAILNFGWDTGNALSLLSVGPFLGVWRLYREWPLHFLCVDKRHRNDSENVMQQENKNVKCITSIVQNLCLQSDCFEDDGLDVLSDALGNGVSYQ